MFQHSSRAANVSKHELLVIGRLDALLELVCAVDGSLLEVAEPLSPVAEMVIEL